MRAFIAAMNVWETEAWAAHEHARENGIEDLRYWEEATQKLQLIYAQYCTPRERPYGRLGIETCAVIGHPPDYNPETEKIIEVNHVTSRRVLILTESPMKGMPTLLQSSQYVFLKVGGEWRVDSKRYLYDDGTSIPNVL